MLKIEVAPAIIQCCRALSTIDDPLHLQGFYARKFNWDTRSQRTQLIVSCTVVMITGPDIGVVMCLLPIAMICVVLRIVMLFTLMEALIKHVTHIDIETC